MRRKPDSAAWDKLKDDHDAVMGMMDQIGGMKVIARDWGPERLHDGVNYLAGAIKDLGGMARDLEGIIKDRRKQNRAHVKPGNLPPEAQKILDVLRVESSGGSRSQIRRRLFGDNVPAAKVGEWLDCLLARGLVYRETVETRGRPATVWRATERWMWIGASKKKEG
jgi:hypothetical protein